MEQSTNNRPATKYQVTIRGTQFTFASFQQIDCHHLSQYFENTITELEQTDAMALIFQQMTDLTTKTAEQANSNFVEMFNICSWLFLEYCKRNPEQPPFIISSPKSPNTNYVFKTRQKAKQTAFDKYWKEHLDQLKDFKAMFGHCNVSRTTPGYPQLGNWLTDQRRKLRGGKLTREQFDMLSDLGVYCFTS